MWEILLVEALKLNNPYTHHQKAAAWIILGTISSLQEAGPKLATTWYSTRI